MISNLSSILHSPFINILEKTPSSYGIVTVIVLVACIGIFLIIAGVFTWWATNLRLVHWKKRDYINDHMKPIFSRLYGQAVIFVGIFVLLADLLLGFEVISPQHAIILFIGGIFIAIYLFIRVQIATKHAKIIVARHPRIK